MPATERVLIAGCGYVGLALAARLARAGHPVWGLRRSPDAAAAIAAAGATPILADLTDPASLTPIPDVDWIVACQSPGRHPGRYRAVYYDGTRHLLDRVAAHPPRRLVFVSSTGVYGHADGRWVDERTDPAPATPSGRVLLETEAAALHSPVPAMVVRLGGIYGPGRTRVDLLRRHPEWLDANEYLNQIRLEDIVELLARVLQAGTPGQTYLGVDGEPVVKAPWYRWLARQIGLPAPASAPPDGPPAGKRCANRKIVDELGVTLRFPTAWAGYVDLLTPASPPPRAR